MSRSRRKTPIVGHTNSPSEREDKKIWHQRWRSREKAVLGSASAEALDTHMTLKKSEVSNVWAMSKDGRSYWPISRQAEMAADFAGRQGRTPQEREALKKRLLRKWMAK